MLLHRGREAETRGSGATALSERRARMRNLKWTVVVGLVALALGAGVVQGQQPPSGEYKIGVLEPLTGNLAVQGKLHLEGYEIMRDLINNRFGGVMGKKLVLVSGDAVDPTAAASEATRLATREGVKIITGTFSSTLCGAASEAASRQNVIYWETSCVDPRFTRRNLKNVFRTEIDGTGFGWYNVEFIAKHLAHRLGKKTNELKIAYLSEDSSYGQSVTESARQRAKQEFGMQEVGLEYYTFTTNDLTPIILKLKSAGPDVLHHIARDQDAILFWRQAREQNFQVKAVVHAGATGYGNPGFGKAFGNDANGPFALLEPGPGLIIEKFRPEGQQVERAFRDAVKTKTGSDVLAGGHQLAGGGLWVLKLVLDAAKSDDLDKFRAAVMSLDLPVGSAVNGWGVKFDETGQNSNARVQHYMLQWQNGSLVTVWPEEFTTNRAKWIPLGPWDQRK
jgi:branched-chain amino acid transport system substrate-binding protein